MDQLHELMQCSDWNDDQMYQFVKIFNKDFRIFLEYDLAHVSYKIRRIVDIMLVCHLSQVPMARDDVYSIMKFIKTDPGNSVNIGFVNEYILDNQRDYDCDYFRISDIMISVVVGDTARGIQSICKSIREKTLNDDSRVYTICKWAGMGRICPIMNKYGRHYDWKMGRSHDELLAMAKIDEYVCAIIEIKRELCALLSEDIVELVIEMAFV